jgi:anti-anti-sigma factor
MADYDRIKVTSDGDLREVTFVDRKMLDPLNIHQMSTEMTGLIGEDVKRLLLRCGDVEFMSSAALNAFILLNKRVMKSGGKLVLCEMRPEIYEVFSLTNLTSFFTICDDRETALAAF